MATPLLPADQTKPEANSEPLARAEGLGSITFCKCGTLSLNIQAMTLRLDMTAFVQLMTMCEQAVTALQSMADHHHPHPTSSHIH